MTPAPPGMTPGPPSPQPTLVRTTFVARGSLGNAARRWLTAGRPEPAPARAAATVILLRDAKGGGVEVFMLRRVPTMKFAPSTWVFPGGGVDERDAAPDVPWAGPAQAEWGSALGVPESDAAALVVAAAREVFEECGVLLAGHLDEEVVSDVSSVAGQSDRDELLARSTSFAELLADRSLQLRTDLLRLVDHWITPEFEPRRYDTWFFTARLPEGQEPDDVTSESDISCWVRPSELLARAGAGEAVLLPPTRVQLEHLTRAANADAALSAQRIVIPVMPVAELDGDDVVLITELPDAQGEHR